MNENLKNQSELLYTQAKQQFDAIKHAYQSGELTTEVAVIQAAFEAFQAFFSTLGEQRFEAIQFDESTPLWSSDYNGMMQEIYDDFEVLFREATLLADAMYVDFNHHVVQHDILSEKLKGIQNKLYDLAAYNSIEGYTTNVFAKEEFLNQDRIDYDKITMSPLTIEGGNVTLPQKSKKSALDDATVSILLGNRANTLAPVGALSNGYPGNSHEIVTSTKDIDSTGKSLSLNFIGASNNHANYGAVLDDNPNTWFEFEKVIPTRLVNSVSEKDYGFSYKTAYDNYHYWTEPLEDGVLKLCLEINLHGIQTINAIEVGMYTPASRLAQTAKVVKILVIDENNNSVNVAYNHTGTFFKFNAMKARAVQLFFEQEHAYTTEIGHIFYTKKYLSEDSNGYKQSVVNRIAEANNRIDGPIPWITDIGAVIEEDTTRSEVFYAPRESSDTIFSVNEILESLRSQIGMEDVEMGVERIQADRYCIGIKDINIYEAEFEEEGELITKPFYFENPLERISLNIDEEDSFNANWLSYDISIDDGITWHPITPLHRQEAGVKTYIIQQVERSSGIIQKEGIIESDKPIYSMRIRVIGRVGEVMQQSRKIMIATQSPVLRTVEIQGVTRISDDVLTYVSEEEQQFFEKEDPPIPPIEIIPEPGIDDKPDDCEICKEPGNTGQDPDDPEEKDKYDPESDPPNKMISLLKSDKYRVCLEHLELSRRQVKITYGAKSTIGNPITEFRVEFDKFPHLNEHMLLKPSEAIEKISKDVIIDLSLLEDGDELIVRTYGKNSSGFEIRDEIMIEISETCSNDWDPADPEGKSNIEIDPRVVIGRVCEHTFRESGELNFTAYVRSYKQILKYEIYEDDTVVDSRIFALKDNVFELNISHYVNKDLYSLENSTKSPYIIVYDALGKKKKKSFRLTLKDCLGSEKEDYLYAEFDDQSAEFCVDERFSYKWRVGSSKRLRQVRIWFNDKEVHNKVYALSSKTTRASGTLRIPYNQLEIGTANVRIEMTDALGQIMNDSRTITFVGDCKEDDDRRKDKINVTARIQKSSYCPCGEDIKVSGTIKVTPALERVLFKINGMAFEPSSLNPLNELDETICKEGYPGYPVPVDPPVVIPDPPEEPVDPEIIQPPTENCRVHFTGGIMAAKPGGMNDFTTVWQEDPFSEFVGAGWSPINSEAFPKAVASSFDGVAIGAGTRLEVWSQPAYQGEKIFDQVGPLILNNEMFKDVYGEELEAGFNENPELNALFPSDKRRWISLAGWDAGSLKITCNSDGPSSPPTELNYNNDVNQPSKNIDFLASNTMPTSSEMAYWYGNLTSPSTGVRDNFIHGRNDWLSMISQTGMLVSETEPFFQNLFKFLKQYASSSGQGIVLPEPFDRFNQWWMANMPRFASTSKSDLMKRLSIYMTYKFKQYTIVLDDMTNHLSAFTQEGAIEEVAKYLVKVPSFTYHWITVSNQSGSGTLAFVMDLSGSEEAHQFLSFANLEENAFSASIQNAKSYRPISYTSTKNKSTNDSNYATYSDNIDPKYWIVDGLVGTHTLSELMNDSSLRAKAGIAAGVETFIHEMGHTISYYAHDAYPNKYPYTQENRRRAFHDWDEWRNISGWPLFTTAQQEASKIVMDGSTSNFSKTNINSTKLTTLKEAPTTAYGLTQPAEDFAEAYATYIINPGYLKDNYPERYAFMETWIKNLPKNPNRVNMLSVMSADATPVEPKVISLKGHIHDHTSEVELEERTLTSLEKLELMIDAGQLKTNITEQDLDFIQAIEEYEIDENCGCRKKKGTKQALQAMSEITMMNATPMAFLEDISPVLKKISENLYSYEFSIPYWFLYESGFASIGRTYELTVEGINTEGRSDIAKAKIKIDTCNEPIDPDQPDDPDDPDDPKEPDEKEDDECKGDVIQALHMTYYDFASSKFKTKRFSMLKGQATSTARTLKDGVGNKIRVGINLQEQSIWVQKISKGEYPGFMIAQVYTEVGPKDLSSSTKYYVTGGTPMGITESIENLVVAKGDIDFDTHYLYDDLRNYGDTSAAPKLIQLHSSFDLMIENLPWDDMCPQKHLNHKPKELKEEMDKEDIEEENCEDHKVVHIQYYDDISNKLRDIYFSLVEGVGETYTVQARNGSRTSLEILAGYSGISKGPAISIAESDENADEYFYVSAIGIGYTQKDGGLNYIYSDSLFYSTRSHEGQSKMLGAPKTLAELDWVVNGVVDKDKAPWIGSKRDRVSTSITLPKNPCNPNDSKWDDLYPIPAEEIINKEQLEKNGVIKFESFVLPVFNNNIAPGEVEVVKARFRVRRTWKGFRDVNFLVRYTFENTNTVTERHPMMSYSGRAFTNYGFFQVVREGVIEFRNMDHYGYGKVVKAEIFVELISNKETMQYPNYSIEIPVERGNRNETMKFAMVASTASDLLNAICINRSVSAIYSFDIAYRLFDADKEITQFGVQIRSSREIIGESYRTYNNVKIVNDSFPVFVDRMDLKQVSEPYYYAVPMVQFKGTSTMVPIANYQLELRTLRCI